MINMRITQFPAYVLDNDEYTSSIDLKRVKNNVTQIEKNLSSLNIDDLSPKFAYSEEDLQLFKNLFLKRDSDIFSLCHLFQRYLILAKSSECDQLIKTSKVFNEDFHILNELLYEISEKKVNSLVFVNFLKKLVSPYRVTIQTFIYIMNNLILKNKSITSPKDDESDFEDIKKLLEG